MEILGYTNHRDAKGALKLLEHLGLGELTDSERNVFLEHYGGFYEGYEYHFLSATCALYEVLPFISAQSDVDEKIRKQRMDEFEKRVNSVRLEPWMCE